MKQTTLEQNVIDYLADQFKWVSVDILRANPQTSVIELGADAFDMYKAISGLTDEFGLKGGLTEQRQALRSNPTLQNITSFVAHNQRHI